MKKEYILRRDNKKTAIICESVFVFKRWCVERRLKYNKQNREAIDNDSEIYICVTRKSDSDGRVFTGFEVVEPIYHTIRDMLINNVKKRIR